MPLSKAQILMARREGKRVLCREIVTEAVYLESIFEDCWSHLIRTKQVPPLRGVLHEKTLAIFRAKVRANEIAEYGVKRWLSSLLTVDAGQQPGCHPDSPTAD